MQNIMVREGKEPSEVDRLANKLIKSLGIEGALSCCRENHWDGVLKVIMLRLRSGGM